jgi:biotin operon repressor
MAVSEARWVEGNKYMWDGAEYASREEAQARADAYKKDGFEILVVEAEGKWLVYTRRVVTEVVIQGEAPPA